MGEGLCGRIVTPLGEAYDGKEAIQSDEQRTLALDVTALGIRYREEISEQLETGITIVDTLIPIGKGQRELLFGEPRSGKTTFVIDTISHQHAQGTVCIYAVVGKNRERDEKNPRATECKQCA